MDTTVGLTWKLSDAERKFIVTAEEADKIYQWVDQDSITKPFAMEDF